MHNVRLDESYYSQIVLRIFLAFIAGMIIGFDSWKNSLNVSIGVSKLFKR